MNIGFGISALQKGISSGRIDGIGVYTKSLLEELDRLDFEKTIVGFGQCMSFSALNQFPNSPSVCLPLPYQAATAITLLTSLPFPGAKQLVGKIKLFHAPDHYIPRLSKIPVVATVMDAIPLVHPEWMKGRLGAMKASAFRQMARSAQQIITISEYSKADIVHYFGIPPERISVTHLGVNPAYLQPVAMETRQAVLRKYGLKTDFFIFVGSILPRKNLARIIEAHSMLPISVQKAYPMVIIGRKGGGAEEVLPIIQALQARGCGCWLDNVTDIELHSLLQSAKALVYPSLYEGFGLPVLEGFAAGIPVISANTTSIPEVAANAAMLVNPESSEEIADAMMRLVENDVLAENMVELGRKRVNEFSWSACAQQTMKIYRNMAD